MKTIAVGDMTLLDLYNPYLDAAKQLGAVDEKRARLNQPAVTPAAQVQSARREWIRWANILLSAAGHADLDADTDALLFSPLREALQRADSRWHTKIAPAPVPAPTPAVAISGPDGLTEGSSSTRKSTGRPLGGKSQLRCNGRRFAVRPVLAALQ